jgi:hypothetical protein
MFAHRPRAGVSLDDDGITLIEPPVPGIDRGTNVMQVAIDFRRRVEGRWGVRHVWVKSEGVRIKTDGEDRLLDGFEGLLVCGGEGEEMFEVLDRMSSPHRSQ